MAIEEGVDVVFVADDIAFKTGTFVSPDVFKPFWLPRMKKISSLVGTLDCQLCSIAAAT